MKHLPFWTYGIVVGCVVFALASALRSVADEGGANHAVQVPVHTTGCPANPRPTPDDRAGRPAIPARTNDALAKAWGIEITSLRLSAQGYFIDFRYRVLDAVKAAPLANHAAKPYLIEAATGQRLPVPSTPKLGPLRQTAQRLAPGRIYYIFFSNSRGMVERGDQVTVVIGDCRIENLTVE